MESNDTKGAPLVEGWGIEGTCAIMIAENWEEERDWIVGVYGSADDAKEAHDGCRVGWDKFNRFLVRGPDGEVTGQLRIEEHNIYYRNA